jgi:hypothetical protein
MVFISIINYYVCLFMFLEGYIRWLAPLVHVTSHQFIVELLSTISILDLACRDKASCGATGAPAPPTAAGPVEPLVLSF